MYYVGLEIGPKCHYCRHVGISGGDGNETAEVNHFNDNTDEDPGNVSRVSNDIQCYEAKFE